MSPSKDPTQALKKAAAALPDAVDGTSCNQTSFKVGKKAFLYIGPGPKGVGYKAMFKLGASVDEAQDLAQGEPQKFGLGVGNWVTTRFSAEEPLPEKIWGRWLQESYDAATGGPELRKKAGPRKKPASRKKSTSRRTATRRKKT